MHNWRGNDVWATPRQTHCYCARNAKNRLEITRLLRNSSTYEIVLLAHCTSEGVTQVVQLTKWEASAVFLMKFKFQAWLKTMQTCQFFPSVLDALPLQLCKPLRHKLGGNGMKIYININGLRQHKREFHCWTHTFIWSAISSDRSASRRGGWWRNISAPMPSAFKKFIDQHKGRGNAQKGKT